MISDRAVRCPKCGNPVIKPTRNTFDVGYEQNEYNNKENDNTKTILYVIIAVLVAALIGLGGWLWHLNHKDATNGYSQIQAIADSVKEPENVVEEKATEQIEAPKMPEVSDAPEPKPIESNIYYVVLGSYSSLQNAKNSSNDLWVIEEGMGTSPVFKGYAKGQTVYRVCNGIFKRKSDAKAHVSDLKNLYGVKAWIWESHGQATCVYRPIDVAGYPMDITPQ